MSSPSCSPNSASIPVDPLLMSQRESSYFPRPYSSCVFAQSSLRKQAVFFGFRPKKTCHGDRAPFGPPCLTEDVTTFSSVRGSRSPPPSVIPPGKMANLKLLPTTPPLFDRGGRADFPPRETIVDCLTEKWGERPFLFLFSLVPRRTPPVQSLTKRLFLD